MKNLLSIAGEYPWNKFGFHWTSTITVRCIVLWEGNGELIWLIVVAKWRLEFGLDLLTPNTCKTCWAKFLPGSYAYLNFWKGSLPLTTQQRTGQVTTRSMSLLQALWLPTPVCQPTSLQSATIQFSCCLGMYWTIQSNSGMKSGSSHIFVKVSTYSQIISFCQSLILMEIVGSDFKDNCCCHRIDIVLSLNQDTLNFNHVQFTSSLSLRFFERFLQRASTSKITSLGKEHSEVDYLVLLSTEWLQNAQQLFCNILLIGNIMIVCTRHDWLVELVKVKHEIISCILMEAWFFMYLIHLSIRK